MPQNTYASSFPADWQPMEHPQHRPLPEPSGTASADEQRTPMYPAVPPASLPGTVQPRRLQMHSGLDLDALDGPFTNAEMAKASLKGLLMRNVGFYIVAGFLVGTQAPVSWEGILYSVGNDYLVIYQPDVDRYITGDLYSLKFVEFHNTQTPTPWAGYRRREGGNSW